MKIAISGAFDPLNVGHVRHIQAAAKHGDLFVILNTDSWIQRNRGEVNLTWEKRAEILRAVKGVKDVIMAKDDDDTVCESLRNLLPHFFAKGGHRSFENTPELALCLELHIGLMWNV